MTNVAKGREAEDRAADFLVGQGYTLLTRRFRVPGGEADIVALDGEVLVIVEVKRRDAPGYDARASIGSAKRAALARAAVAYANRYEMSDRTVRTDLVIVEKARIELVRDIFSD